MDYGNWTTRDDVKGQSWSNLREKGPQAALSRYTRYGLRRRLYTTMRCAAIKRKSYVALFAWRDEYWLQLKV